MRFVSIALLLLSASSATSSEPSKLRQLDAEAIAIRDSVPADAVIAHRGLPYWAPEETAPSYQLALGLGVDYLDADIQRTKDGILICLHDDNLQRTTNIGEIFPDRQDDPVSKFTLAELLLLDAGSWFNKDFPFRASDSFVGLTILTLEELIDLVEESPKPWPGLSLETKEAKLFKGIEADLHGLLEKRGWDGTDPDRRLLLQTFERSSLPLLENHFPQAPKILLLWKGEGYMERVDEAEFVDWLNFGVDNGAQFAGPSLPGPAEYYDLMQDWMVKLMRDARLAIHAYTLNDDFEIYDAQTDGLFTDRADLLKQYYHVRDLRRELGRK
jgi:glycerophosphoryl diester phosphodiesterase